MHPEAGGTGSSSDIQSNHGLGYSRFGVEHKKITIDGKSESYFLAKPSYEQKIPQ
jgi:hypothetical protein